MTLYLTSKKIIKDWTDYNGHMNVAYYVLIFDIFGAEILMNKFQMGEESAKTTKKSTMVVESHITYNQEVKEGEDVDVNLIFFDHDKKRLQYKLEMIHKEKKYVASTIEVLSLYVDLNQRKVIWKLRLPKRKFKRKKSYYILYLWITKICSHNFLFEHAYKAIKKRSFFYLRH